MSACVASMGSVDGPVRLRQRGLVAACFLGTGITYAMLSGLDATVPAMIAFFSAMALATVTDLERRKVPNRLLVIATPVVATLLVVAELTVDSGGLGSSLASAVLLAGTFLAIHLISPKSFGAGDVKISPMIGLAIGWFGIGQVQWFLLWMVLGLLVVGGPILRRRGRRSQAMVPLVPILSIASATTLLIAAA